MAGRRPVAANRRPHPVAQMKPVPHNDPPAAPDGLVPTGWERSAGPGLTAAELVTGEAAQPAGNASGAFPDVDVATDEFEAEAYLEAGVAAGYLEKIEVPSSLDMVDLTPGEAAIMTELLSHRQALANLAERQDWMINSIGQALGQFQQVFGSGRALKMLGAIMKVGKNGG
jgi:hypothetical protein